MHADFIELTSRLVAIDSVNPALVPGGAGEAEIARFVTGWARAAGLEADVLEATPGRPSVVVRARPASPSGSSPASPRGGGRTLLLCAHMDTVGVVGMADPHAPRLDGDRLHGRGAYDMKAGLASALLACRELAVADLAGDVVVAAVADEEHASLSVQEVLGAVGADAAIVTEPTELELIVAHKGFAWAEVEIGGRAAHPDLDAERRTLLVREPFEVARDAAAGIPTVMFGASGEGALAVEEWVSVEDSVAVARTLITTARRLCA